MSIDIQKLYKDEREVGKNIRGTKKYYVWEFVLNGTFHKIEIFHSKITGKKKLCLDAQQLVADQGYQSSFTYSFKIKNHYFNILQESLDQYDLRIDNKLFENLMQDERSGRLKPPSKPPAQSKTITKQTDFRPKFDDEPIPEYLRTVDSYKRNNDNFFEGGDDDDFDFSGGKSNSNNFSFKRPDVKKPEIKKKPDSDLLGFSDIAEIKKAQLSSISGIGGNSQGNAQANAKTFEHNQNIFNSINIFSEDKKPNEIPNYNNSNSNSNTNAMLENIFSGSNTNTNTNSNKGNYNDFINTNTNNNNNFGDLQFNTNPITNANPYPNVNSNMNQNNNMQGFNIKPNEPYGINPNYQNPMNYRNSNNVNVNMNIGFGEIQSTQANRNSNLNTNTNTNTNLNMNMGIGMNTNSNLNQYNQPQYPNQSNSILKDNNANSPMYAPIQSSSPNFKQESSPFSIMQSTNSISPSMMNNQPSPYQTQPQDIQPQSQQYEPKNDFKAKVLSSGLVDFDNLLSNQNNAKNSNSNYNFSIQPSMNQYGNQYGANTGMSLGLSSNYQPSSQSEPKKSSTPFDF